MEFYAAWMLLLALNLLVWALLSRLHRFRQLVDRITIPRPHVQRHSASSVTSSSFSTFAYQWQQAYQFCTEFMLAQRNDFHGFESPRVTRSLISFLIIWQNVIAILLSAQDEQPVRAISTRAGQLAVANMLPLLFFVGPDAIFFFFSTQCRVQVMWAHSLYGWIVWYEVLLHLSTSLAGTSRYASWNDFSPMFVGMLACLFIAINMLISGIYAIGFARKSHVASSIVGLVFIIGHVTRSLLATILAISSLLFSLLSIRLLTRSERSDVRPIEAETVSNSSITKLEFSVPEGHGSFYFKLGGIPVRAAWTEVRTSSEGPRAIVLHGTGLYNEKPLSFQGPFRTPMTPYFRGPPRLDIIATDSGVFEGYACFRWRRRNSYKLQTRLYWFSESHHLLEAFLKHLQVLKLKDIYIVTFGDPLPERLRERLEQAIYINTVISNKGTLREALKAHRPFSVSQYVIGESLRSYLQTALVADDGIDEDY